MSRRLIVRAEAEADLTKAALWYDKREPGLGLELTLEVRAAIRRALEDPLLYLLLRERPEVRRICQGVFLIAFSSSCEMTPLLCLPSSMPPVMTDIGENGYDPSEPVNLSLANARYPARLHERLGANAPEQLSAFGNLGLLSLPKTALFCSTRCPGKVILTAYD